MLPSQKHRLCCTAGSAALAVSLLSPHTHTVRHLLHSAATPCRLAARWLAESHDVADLLGCCPGCLQPQPRLCCTTNLSVRKLAAAASKNSACSPSSHVVPQLCYAANEDGKPPRRAHSAAWPVATAARFRLQARQHTLEMSRLRLRKRVCAGCLPEVGQGRGGGTAAPARVLSSAFLDVPVDARMRAMRGFRGRARHGALAEGHHR